MAKSSISRLKRKGKINMSLDTYIVEGGVGKCVSFTSLLPLLEKKAEAKVNVMTPYTDVFQNNPSVAMVIDSTNTHLSHPEIQKSDNIYFAEPYKNNFALGKQHIIESFCELLGIEYSDQLKPKLYSGHVEKEKDELLKKLESDKYFIVQFAGGQAPIGYQQGNPYNNLDPGRIYNPFFAQKLINLMKESYPTHKILNMALPNEPQYENAIPVQAPYMVFHELLKESDGFIGCDSLLNHFSISANKKGVVIWGSTRWVNFGYTQNQNVNCFMENEWDDSKFDGANPLNSMVSPEKVMELFEKRNNTVILKGKKKEVVSLHCSRAVG